MTRFVGYIAMSLDARIADGAGNLGWLDEYEMSDAMKADYAAFYADIDALVMGRTTFDWVVKGHEWSYGGKPCYVVTSRPLETGRDDILPVPVDYAALGERIARAGHRRVWIVGGGKVQRACLDAGMFDSIRVFVIPAIVGSGPLIFADGATRRLRLVQSRAWPGGAVELEYEFGEDR